MIIPIKCFTCGKVLGDKYLYFKNEVKKMKVGENLNENSVIYLSENNNKKILYLVEYI